MSFLEQVLQWDTQLFLELNSWGTPLLDPVFLAISKVAIWIPLYAFFVFLIFKKFKIIDAVVIIAGAVVVTILTDQLSVHAFKNVFERQRPCWNESILDQLRLVKDYCGGQYGFVSSHATNTFGFAIFMGNIFNPKIKGIKIALLIWALIISFSRIYLGVHYPLDVFVGGLLGVFLGNLVYVIVAKKLS